MSNAGHLDFVLNWVAHLWALNVTSFLIGALDEDMLWELVDREIPAFSLSAGLDKGDWGWGGTAFIAAVSFVPFSTPPPPPPFPLLFSPPAAILHLHTDVVWENSIADLLQRLFLSST